MIRPYCKLVSILPTKTVTMKKIINFLVVCSVLFLASCSSKPTSKEISKKILLEYVCAETAEVNNLKIENTEETKNLMGKRHIVILYPAKLNGQKAALNSEQDLSPEPKNLFKR